MRYSQPEKMEIIRVVEQSALSVKRTPKELGSVVMRQTGLCLFGFRAIGTEEPYEGNLHDSSEGVESVTLSLAS